MFQRLYELGNFLGADLLQEWELLNHGMEEHYDRGFAICFDTEGIYTGIKTISSNLGVSGQGVVYLPGLGAKSPPLSPCTLLSGKMDAKIHNLFQCTEDVGQEKKIAESMRSWFQAINWQDKDLQKRVVVDLADKAVEAGVGQKWEDNKRIRSGYCFPALKNQDMIKPVYMEEAAKELMVTKAVRAWSTYKKKEIQRRGVCSICGREEVVFGNFSELKCYNLDKPGMITGGFLLPKADINFPVCKHCALTMSYAINYAQNNLQAQMAGQDYLVLPYCSAGGEIMKFIKEELEARPSRFSISSQCDPLVNFDEELLQFMQEEKLKEQLAFALIFFKKQNKEWKILSEVQQVLPGRLRAVQRARNKAMTDQMLIHSGKDGQAVSISGQTLSIFAAGSGARSSGRIVRQWLATVFGGGKIDKKVLFHSTCKKILVEQRQNPQALNFFAAQAWGLYLFFHFLDLFPQGGKPMASKFPDSPMGRYMEKHSEFFRRSEMIVAFLTGSYVSTVVSVQADKRNMKLSKAPFVKKFIGRLLNQKHFRRLFREGHDKLAQYEALGIVVKNRLETDLAQAWVECGDKWRISDDEATFAFTLGYSLAWRITVEDKTEEDSNNGGR